MRRNNIYELCAMSAIMNFGSNPIWQQCFRHIDFVILKEMQKMNMMVDFSEITNM